MLHAVYLYGRLVAILYDHSYSLCLQMDNGKLTGSGAMSTHTRPEQKNGPHSLPLPRLTVTLSLQDAVQRLCGWLQTMANGPGMRPSGYEAHEMVLTGQQVGVCGEEGWRGLSTGLQLLLLKRATATHEAHVMVAHRAEVGVRG